MTDKTRGTSFDTAVMVLEVLRLIPRKRFITANEIHQSLLSSGHERSLRSTQRLLETLITRFPIEQDTRSKPYGYRWRKDSQGFQLSALDTNEALLLQLARVHILDFLPANITRQLEVLFSTAAKNIDNKPSNNVDKRWLKKVHRVPSTQPLLPPKLNPGVFEAISEALYYEQKLEVSYVNASGAAKTALIHPLGLALQEPRLYLVCRFDSYDNERILSLARISKARVLNENFVYPKDFDLSRYDGEGRFAFGEGKQVHLSFCIEKKAGRYLSESPLSLDQRLEEQEDCLAISATVTDSLLLHSWLRGLGDVVWQVNIQPVIK